mmetsp:Transcript_17191/g.35731  ORF Transcript_17191/g.35731 Transcript_17191/m.35731 type:complete len:306 (+) Transcript_17191:767-1684(+)
MRWILEIHHFEEGVAVLEEYLVSADGYVGDYLVATNCLQKFVKQKLQLSSAYILGYVKTARQCAACSSRAQGCLCSMEERMSSRYGIFPTPCDWESFSDHYAKHSFARTRFPVIWIGSFGQGHAMVSESCMSSQSVLELKTRFTSTYSPTIGAAMNTIFASSSAEDRGRADLTCDTCCKTFSRHSSLTRHVMEVHGNITLRCEYCDCRFTNSGNLRRHVLNAHQKGQPHFRCSICNELFTTKYNVNRHLRRKHEGLGQVVSDPSTSSRPIPGSITAECERRQECPITSWHPHDDSIAIDMNVGWP